MDVLFLFQLFYEESEEQMSDLDSNMKRSIYGKLYLQKTVIGSCPSRPQHSFCKNSPKRFPLKGLGEKDKKSDWWMMEVTRCKLSLI